MFATLVFIMLVTRPKGDDDMNVIVEEMGQSSMADVSAWGHILMLLLSVQYF